MIQELLRPDVNGMFLFYFKGQDENFAMPPGLSPAEVEDFKHEFLTLFEKYATIANRRQHG